MTNNLFYSHQSAYRAGHSTETAILKIVNDLLSALYEDKVSLLSLLDLSAASDTIDHSILLSRLSYSFGISDTVLAWFTSYLTDRTQTISVNGSKSLSAPLHYGVPQESVLGPILFVLYTQPLSKTIRHHSLYHHSFSDDNQLFISANLAQLQEIIRTSQSCISDVQAWMQNNKLQLNPDKTKIILIASKHNQKSLSLPFSVDLNGTSIHLFSPVRNLGVTFDQNLSFQQHVSRTCQICYFELRRINFIRHYLSQDALKTLISAFVLSRIDYCNSLLACCPKQLIHKFQKVQNNAARLICRTPKFDHISPVLHTLHWLPVEQRIEYKLLLLAFKCVNNDSPSSLSDLLKFYIPSRQLRSSSDTYLLRIPSFHQKSFGQRKFSYQASVLWNSLPISLRHSNSTLAFKSALKLSLIHI